MTFISNTSRLSSLTIAGIDYTSNFISWAVSDESANRNGCIITSGTLVLGTKLGGKVIEDYDRNNFRRGDLVTLNVTEPGGGSVPHPRGYLYVVSTSYSPENEQLSIELTCRLGLMSLNEDFEALLDIVPIQLDVAQSTFENCCASFSSTGQYIYQNSSGDLQSGYFFDGDTNGTAASGQWVSILGTTTNSVGPLVASGAIPDEISLLYQVPQGDLSQDQKGRIDIVETTSYFFFNYPAVNFQRINTNATAENPNGTLDNVTNITETPAPEAGSSSCGNTPEPPLPPSQEGSNASGNGNSCNEGYALIQVPQYVPATRVQTITSKYDGPGAQLSSSEGVIVGPRVEANGQYFADDYAYCRQTWGDQCSPNGNCPKKGLDNIVLGKTVTLNEFGEANEVVRTTVDNYATVLSAAQPSDWRAGNANGRIQDFDFSLATNEELYRQTRVITEYTVEESVNVQTTTTFSSLTTRGIGITAGQNLDALSGIETKTVRRSATITALDITPDILNTATTTTESRSTNIILFSGRYKIPPSESGPYVLEEQIPVPLLFEDEVAIQNVVNDYSNYISRFTKGDAFGLQVGESLRSEVLSNWVPNMPFRYYDASKGRLMALRMDATTWGIDDNGAYFVTDGVWIGFSNGGVVIPSNVQGNSSPDMNGPITGVNPGTGQSTPASPTPPPPTVPPSVLNETAIDSGSFGFTVNVFFNFSSGANVTTPDGIQKAPPGPEERNVFTTTTFYVRGTIVGPGQILAANPDGSIPLEYNGGLIVADATVIDIDVFSDDD